MQVLITGRHVDVTAALRRYIESRMKRLERYESKLGDVQVILGVEKYRHTAEAVLTVNGVTVQAKASTKEMYASIDELMDKVSRQLTKRKQKLTRRKTGRTKRFPTLVGPVDRSAHPPEIPTVRVSLDRMSVAEAAGRLPEDPGAVLVFHNEASDRIQVIRRLETGAMELIDPRAVSMKVG
jgi:putative sigma-54 modulation protein